MMWTSDVTDASCVACGATDPPGGLRLGPAGGGAEYDWLCRRSVACAQRIARQLTQPTTEETE